MCVSIYRRVNVSMEPLTLSHNYIKRDYIWQADCTGMQKALSTSNRERYNFDTFFMIFFYIYVHIYNNYLFISTFIFVVVAAKTSKLFTKCFPHSKGERNKILKNNDNRSICRTNMKIKCSKYLLILIFLLYAYIY